MFSLYLPHINIWAILVAVLIHFFVGAAWYSNLLFSKPWRAELPQHKRKGSIIEGIIVTLVGGLFAFGAIALLVGYAGANTYLGGLKIALLAWFVSLFVYVTNSAYQGGSRKLILIDNSYMLVTFAIAGALLGAWQ